MNSLPHFVIFFFSNVLPVLARISCMDDANRPIEWYAMYKLPKIETENERSNLGRGESYAYLKTRNLIKDEWVLSEKGVSESHSILGNTLKAFFDNKKNLTYLLYNDEPAVEDRNAQLAEESEIVSGHTKGKQLLFNHPLIYSKGHQKAVIASLDEDVKSLFGENPQFVNNEPFSRIANLKSFRNATFTSFAKDGRFDKDLYDGLVAPNLRTSLLVETWRRGPGTPLPPSCGTQYEVEDITSINITVFESSSGRYRPISFSSRDDHSKWAASSESQSYWVCIGDINRMKSQWTRGGGTVCFRSSAARRAYTSTIKATDHCE